MEFNNAIRMKYLVFYDLELDALTVRTDTNYVEHVRARSVSCVTVLPLGGSRRVASLQLEFKCNRLKKL